MQKVGGALAAANITLDDWKAAFGSELGMLADWPSDMHWPSLVITSAVKDPTRARKIVAVLTKAIDEDAIWNEADRGGAHYWSMQAGPSFVAIRPVIALSNRVLIAGVEERSVEGAMHRAESSSSELSASDAFKRASRSVPPPTNFFGYVDLGLLYQRLDATVRPVLLMSAAFVPAINEYIDAGKLPTAEVVTRHLTPIVSSQRYKDGGYIAESVGPVTLNQSGIGVAVVAAMGALGYQRGMVSRFNPRGFAPATPAQTPAPSPASPSPSGTP
jgi:hypothetical protein